MFKEIINRLIKSEPRLKEAIQKTILVIEDGEVERKVISHTLEKRGYRVLTAADGESGFKTAQEQKPDLILLDIILPDTLGTEVCKKLKMEHSTQNIPVIFLTAKDTPNNVIDSYEVGAEYFLAKPISAKTLIQQVEMTFKDRDQTKPS